MFSKTFCPLPWIHLATRPNGDVRLCCTSNASGAGATDNKTIGLVTDVNLKTHTIDEVWNSNFMSNTRLQMLKGEIPNSCKKCFVEEQHGITSKRQWETIVWKDRIDLESIVSQTDSSGRIPVEIPYFDLRLGNTCQLKCIMCSPHDSSSWVKDWKLQYPKYQTIELKQDQSWDSNFDYTWYQKNSFIESIKSQAKFIKELYFAGGEPLLIPEHYSILNFMVDNKFSKDCVLRYNSNGLEVTDDLIRLWGHFKKVTFNFSIDAVGEKNDYIRYPSKWNNVEEKLRILDNTNDNIVVNIACAVQVLNVLSLNELIDWKLSQNFKKIHLCETSNGVLGTHLVYLPSYLNIRVLPHQLKLIARDRILQICHILESNIQFNNSIFGRNRFEGIIKYMLEEDWSHKLPHLVEYLTICDKQRSTDFKKIFTELGQLNGTVRN